jgi:hypothetical protein
MPDHEKGGKGHDAEDERLVHDEVRRCRGSRGVTNCPRALEAEIRAKLADWRALLRAEVQEARQVLELLLAERLVFTPTVTEDGARCYALRATFALGRICSGILRSHGLASPAGFATCWTLTTRDEWTRAA